MVEQESEQEIEQKEETAGSISDRVCHVDCREYLPIDVFKGFCSLRKEKVMADDSSCEKYHPAMKCRLCGNYTPSSNGESLGLCMEKSVAYPEMLAKTCEWFRWKDESADD